MTEAMPIHEMSKYLKPDVSELQVLQLGSKDVDTLLYFSYRLRRWISFARQVFLKLFAFQACDKPKPRKAKFIFVLCKKTCDIVLERDIHLRNIVSQYLPQFLNGDKEILLGFFGCISETVSPKLFKVLEHIGGK